MDKQERPAVPPPASRQTPAAARHSHASRVRTAVRTQLALSQRRRRELSHALRALRHDLREFRSQVRMRLRDLTHEIATRRLSRPKPAAPLNPLPPAFPAQEKR
jgi:hypothetical protein